MGFQDYLKRKDVENVEKIPAQHPKVLTEEKTQTPEELLRGAHFKIKSVHGTKFGTEYLMAKKYDEDDIQELLKDYTLKFDDKSIFVIY